MSQFFGKYRGKVVGNLDPMSLGRVQVSVPAVLGEGRSSWAMPCAPYAGPGVGLFAIPPTDANVWVEFEAGDPDYPIWCGCFWGSGDAPASPATPDVKVLKTGTATLKLDDTGNPDTLASLKHALPLLSTDHWLLRLCANKKEICAFGSANRVADAAGVVPAAG